MAFPLVALQYNELEINVTLRPINELFVIRDVEDTENLFPHIQSNQNIALQQFYRFLQPPPDISLNTTTSYSDKRTNWNADIHLISTYGFLTDEESKIFAAKEQKYLFKSIYEWKYFNVTGNQKVKLDSTMGMVSSWMWYFQRSDIDLRNEWSNYTNWPYSNTIPQQVDFGDMVGDLKLPCNPVTLAGFGPGLNPSNMEYSGITTTGNYNVQNQKDILMSLGILLDGKYRENNMDSGIYN